MCKVRRAVLSQSIAQEVNLWFEPSLHFKTRPAPVDSYILKENWNIKLAKGQGGTFNILPCVCQYLNLSTVNNQSPCTSWEIKKHRQISQLAKQGCHGHTLIPRADNAMPSRQNGLWKAFFSVLENKATIKCRSCFSGQNGILNSPLGINNSLSYLVCCCRLCPPLLTFSQNLAPLHQHRMCR